MLLDIEGASVLVKIITCKGVIKVGTGLVVADDRVVSARWDFQFHLVLCLTLKYYYK